MCQFTCTCQCNSIYINNCTKISNLLNLIQIILNFLLILFNVLRFTSFSLDFILKTGYIFNINNIFFCFLMLLISVLIKFYAKKNYLIKDKKQTSLYFILLCFFVTSINCILSYFSISKIRSTYLSNRYNNYYNKYNNELKQIKLLFFYLIIIFGLYLILGVSYFISSFSLYHLGNIIFNNDINNEYNNRNNISYLSTKSDINDNNQDIIINNLNERKKNNNFYFFSQNIINQIEKEYEDKDSQTNIKGIMNK